MADFIESEAEVSEVRKYCVIKTLKKYVFYNFLSIFGLLWTKLSNTYKLIYFWFYKQHKFCSLLNNFPRFLLQEEDLDPHERKKLKKVKAMDDSSEEEEDG